MAHPGLVLGVAGLHYFCRVTAFLDPITASLATATWPDTWAGCLALFALCLLLLDAAATQPPVWCPARYWHRLSRWSRGAVDTVAVFLLLEFGMICIWSRLEQVVQAAVRAALLDRRVGSRQLTAADVKSAGDVLSCAMAALLLANSAWVTCWWTTVAVRVSGWRSQMEAWLADRRERRAHQLQVAAGLVVEELKKQEQQRESHEFETRADVHVAVAASAPRRRLSQPASKMELRSGGNGRQRKKMVCMMCEEQDD